MFYLGILVLLIAVILLTDVTFLWVRFFGVLFATAFITAVILKRLRFAQSANDSDEPPRYSPAKPPTLSPMLDLFDPRATEFSLSNAQFFAHLSWVAYRPKDKVEQIEVEWNCKIHFLEEDNHVALVVSLPSALILAFRGTDDLKDVKTDVNIFARKTPWGKVHSGFSIAIQALWPKIQRKALSQPHEREKKLWKIPNPFELPELPEFLVSMMFLGNSWREN